MTPSDLELFTTRELLDELLRRKTFLGVVIHSEEELKHDTWTGDRIFKVHFNSNLNVDQACRLLDVIVDRMERECG